MTLDSLWLTALLRALVTEGRISINDARRIQGMTR